MKTILVSLDNLGDCIINLTFYKYLSKLSDETPYIWISKYAEDMIKILNEPINYYSSSGYWHEYPIIGRGNFFEFIRDILKLRKEKFDRAIILHSNTHKNLACLLMGVKKRFAFKGKFATDYIEYDKNKHILENYKNALKKLTNKNIEENLYYNLNINTKLLKEKLPENLKNLNYIAFHPFSASKKRVFSTSQIMEIINLITQKFNKKLILISTQEEKEKLNFIKSPNILFSSEHSKDLIELSSIIYHSELFIGQDSGILHLAALLNKKFIGFFSLHKKNIISPPSRNKNFVIEYKNTPQEIKITEIEKALYMLITYE